MCNIKNKFVTARCPHLVVKIAIGYKFSRWLRTGYSSISIGKVCMANYVKFGYKIHLLSSLEPLYCMACGRPIDQCITLWKGTIWQLAIGQSVA